MECSICYDAIDTTTGVATLSCAHSFHICCIAGWFAKLEKGTCPCCRKEMSSLEDLPQPAEEGDESDEDEDEDEEDEEVELSPSRLDALLLVRGGQGLTDAMTERIFADIQQDAESSAPFLAIELNAIILGNGGRPLTEREWDFLVERLDDEEDEDEDDDNDVIAAAVAAAWNELSSYDTPERAWLMADGSWVSTVMNPEEATEVAVVASPAAAASVATNAATKMQAVWRGFKGRLSVRM
jgi:hypothetical protein